MAGAQGPTGRTGAAGPQGVIGQTGAQGSGSPQNLGSQYGAWTPYRDFWFDSNNSMLQSSDTTKVSDIANYVTQNPTQHVGIDGSIDPKNPDLGSRRVNSVRDALIQAGVPASKIQIGSFGNPQLQRDRRVEVLVSSS
jgi:outer membrane protein OmpA-like peptidoglycan-associated protein